MDAVRSGLPLRCKASPEDHNVPVPTFILSGAHLRFSLNNQTAWGKLKNHTSVVHIAEVDMAQGRPQPNEEHVRKLDDQERLAALKRDVPTLEKLWSEQF